MIYRVLPSPTARRDIGALPEAVAEAATEFIFGALADNPHRVGKALLGPLEGKHSARRGQYRVIYVIDDEATTVTILRITHRRDAHGP